MGIIFKLVSFPVYLLAPKIWSFTDRWRFERYTARFTVPPMPLQVSLPCDVTINVINSQFETCRGRGNYDV